MVLITAAIFQIEERFLTWSSWNCASQSLLKEQRVCSFFMVCNHMLVLGNMPRGPTYVSSGSWKCIIHEGNIRIRGNGINSWLTWHILYFFQDLFPFKDVSCFLKKKCVDCQVIRFSRSLVSLKAKACWCFHSDLIRMAFLQYVVFVLPGLYSSTVLFNPIVGPLWNRKGSRNNFISEGNPINTVIAVQFNLVS